MFKFKNFFWVLGSDKKNNDVDLSRISTISHLEPGSNHICIPLPPPPAPPPMARGAKRVMTVCFHLK